MMIASELQTVWFWDLEVQGNQDNTQLWGCFVLQADWFRLFMSVNN
jgi:hypothetical protein